MKIWRVCSVCNHLHTDSAAYRGMKSHQTCKNRCCAEHMGDPVATERCLGCWGMGRIREQLSDDRKAEVITCPGCLGKGVVLKKEQTHVGREG